MYISHKYESLLSWNWTKLSLSWNFQKARKKLNYVARMLIAMLLSLAFSYLNRFNAQKLLSVLLFYNEVIKLSENTFLLR